MKKNSPIQLSLSVSRKEYITPSYIRIFLSGDNLEVIADATPGVNNKILIPPSGVNTIYFPEYDFEKREWKPLPDEVRPIVRTYTHRGIDLEKNEIWIDFAVHGDNGPASAWALRAEKGDVLGVMMKEGKTALYPEADHYLLVGDSTAIPVLGAILEDLPEHASGTCIIEVPRKEDEQILYTKSSITFIWLHNENPQNGSSLAAKVKEQLLPEENRSAYVAAEFSSVKEIRNYLRKEKGWDAKELYAYSYWKSGEAEDKSAVERHQENETL